MSDGVRVTIEADGETESVRIHDDAGQVSAGSASFRFSVDAPESADADGEGSEAASETDGDPRRVAPLGAVPTDGTLRCEARSGRRGTEVILRRDGDGVSAWRNSCPHRPEVRLDPGGGAIVDDDRIVCHKHGARFECGDGYCSSGPCRGDSLEAVAVEVRAGDVYLTDDRFEACHRLER